MRWMYSLQNIEQNLLFGYGPADMRESSLLWNVYSFYATYAAVDGFQIHQTICELNELNILTDGLLQKLVL